MSGVDDLRRRNSDRAFAGRTAPEVVGINILEVVEGVDKIAVAALRGRLAGSGVGHCQRHDLGVTGRQGVDVGAHPAISQRDGTSVVPGIGVIVGTPMLQFVNLEAGAIGLQRLIGGVVLIGDFLTLGPIAETCKSSRQSTGKQAQNQSQCTHHGNRLFQHFHSFSSFILFSSAPDPVSAVRLISGRIAPYTYILHLIVKKSIFVHFRRILFYFMSLCFQNSIF